jgi:hypothetical protein
MTRIGSFHRFIRSSVIDCGTRIGIWHRLTVRSQALLAVNEKIKSLAEDETLSHSSLHIVALSTVNCVFKDLSAETALPSKKTPKANNATSY